MQNCQTKTCCFAGAGEIFLKKYDPCCGKSGDPVADAPFLSIGNASSFQIDADVTEIKVEDYTNAAGGVDCSTSWISSARASITGLCLKPENFARAWSGNITNKVTQTVSLCVKAYAKDSFIPFTDESGNPVTNVDINSVSGFSELGVRNVDYVVTPSGIKILETSSLYLEYSNANVPITNCDGTITGFMYPPTGLRDPLATVEVKDGTDTVIGYIYPTSATAHSVAVILDCDTPTTVGYAVNENKRYIESCGAVTHEGYNLVEMLTTASQEFTLFYTGVNRFGGQPFSTTLFRVKLKPVSGIPLIGTAAAEANYEFEILKDNCRSEAPGFSQYGTLAIV